MSLDQGGHLTHGSPVNFSGPLLPLRQLRRGSQDRDHRLRRSGAHRQRGAARSSSWAARSAYPRIIDFERMGAIAREVGAYFMVDMAHIAGLVAAGAHPSPVPHADVVTSTSHKTLRGPRGGFILSNDEDIAKTRGQGRVPRRAGRPAHARHRRQGRRVRRGRAALLQGVHRPRGGERRTSGTGHDGRRPAPRLRRHRQPPVPRGPHARRRHRQGRREAAGERGPHGEQELHPQRDPRSPFVTSGIRVGSALRPPRAVSPPRISTRWASSSPLRCSTPRASRGSPTSAPR